MTVVDTGMFDNMKQFFLSLDTYATPPTEISGFQEEYCEALILCSALLSIS